MQRRSTTVLLVLILIVLAGALGYMIWMFRETSQTISDMQQELRNVEVNTAMISSSSQTSTASSKLLTSYKINTAQKINDKGRRDVNVSVTPMEYTKSAKVSVVISGEEFDLKKDGNVFSATCWTEDFLIGDMTVTITDGDSVQTEVLTGVIDPVYGPVDGAKTFANVQVNNKGDSTTVSGEINVVASEVSGVPEAENMRFVVRQENEELDSKKIKSMSTTVSVNMTVKNTLKGKTEMYLIVDGSDGNRYEYSIPAAGTDTATNYNYNNAITLDKVTDNSGKVIWHYIEGSK
ncbi:MAG: hypothetical protein IKS63_03460 [Firmicutes bacterium]|nr:hypothetical protein [Bacillota bacterium]